MTETLTLPTRAETRKSERIPVAVLGATGSVGQRFVQLLESHPWFRLHEVVASERSAGRTYGDAADWRLDTLLPTSASALEVKALGAELESRLVFSGLDSSVAGEAEDDYANRGRVVVSNSRNHRMDADVPLLIPEINADHLGAIRNFTGEPQRLNLPSAPKQPLHYASEPDRPQPRLDRDREHGMAVTVGRLRPCPLLDIRMVALVHNTIRGAAGAALLNAELLEAKGML